jgi:hypothetical protein
MIVWGSQGTEFLLAFRHICPTMSTVLFPITGKVHSLRQAPSESQGKRNVLLTHCERFAAQIPIALRQSAPAMYKTEMSMMSSSK